MLHKPKGVLTTMEDPLGRPTIAEYIKHLPVRLFPVGRLDWDSEGLLLLTNDGEYAQKITHPSSEITKTYLVKVDGYPKREDLEKLKSGVSIIGGKAKALVATWHKKGESKKYSWIKVVITEGRNRQIRNMFEKIGFDVLKLQRVAIGRLRLGALPKGEIAILNEVAADRALTNFLSHNQNEEDGVAAEGFGGAAGATGGASARSHGKSSSREGSVRGDRRSTSSLRYQGGKLAGSSGGQYDRKASGFGGLKSSRDQAGEKPQAYRGGRSSAVSSSAKGEFRKTEERSGGKRLNSSSSEAFSKRPTRRPKSTKRQGPAKSLKIFE